MYTDVQKLIGNENNSVGREDFRMNQRTFKAIETVCAWINDAIDRRATRAAVARMPCNEHGHFIVEFVGSDARGEAEIHALTLMGFDLVDPIRQCLVISGATGYDAAHRLITGRVYRMAIMPGDGIPIARQRTTGAVKALAAGYGYTSVPRAGHVVHARKVLPAGLLKAMGFKYISALHEPISDFRGHGKHFVVSDDLEGPAIGVGHAGPEDDSHGEWGDRGGFLYEI